MTTLGSDVVVIGGGIVGWAAAYRLIRAGASVTLIDRHDQGQATAAGAGIISPGTSFRASPQSLDLSRAAVEYYPHLLDQLAEDGETSTGFATPGILFVFTSDEEYEQRDAIRAFAEARKAAGTGNIGDVSLLDGTQAKELFPPLANLPGALHMSGASRVDGRLIRDSLRRASITRGVTLVTGSAEISREGDRITSVRIGHRTIPTEAVLIAGGAWSPELGERLGVKLPIDPQRGQILHLEFPGTATGDWSIVHGFSNHYILTFPDSRVVAGATREDGSDFDYRQTAGGVHQELDEALRVAPGLASATLLEVRIGFRPFSRDGLPILGQVPGIRNAWLATGHGPSGLQLGPVSGAAVADMVLDAEPVTPIEAFSPARFHTV